MKIDVVGCHCTWMIDLSTSFIINDEIALDAPQGSFKTLLTKYDITKIKYIFITHFHSDHFMDTHLLLDYLCHHCKNQRITIVAPKGCKERLFEMFKVVEVSYLENYINEMVDFIECENNKKFVLDGYKIKVFKMTHQNLDAYGYTIEKDNVKVGFTGDTCMCNNVYKIIKASKMVFIDASNVEPNHKHLSAQEVIDLSNEFKDTKIIPVHMSKFSKPILQEHMMLPYEGQVFYID